MTKRYQRRVQPAVPAIQWDGSEHTLLRIQEEAGRFMSMVVHWKSEHGLQMSIITPGADQFVAYGDWVLFTPEGLFVSRASTFETWYYEVEDDDGSVTERPQGDQAQRDVRGSELAVQSLPRKVS